MFPITAGLGALSCLTSLLQSSTSSSSHSGNPLGLLGQILGDGDGDKKQDASPVGSGGTTPPFNSGTLASLIALQGQKGDGAKAQSLFAKLDTNGDGTISKSEFENVLGAGGAPLGGLSSLLHSADGKGAKTETATNADGSTTTTITYADGSTVSMTAPAASSGSDGDTAQGQGGSKGQIHLLERLIKLQSQYLAQTSSGVSTVA